MSHLTDMVRALAMLDNAPEFEPIMVCQSCGYRAPFGLMRPAVKYPGNVRCGECGSDKTEAESLSATERQKPHWRDCIASEVPGASCQFPNCDC